MPKKTEAQILGDAYTSMRNLSNFYISKLENVDINKELEINGTKFNSAHWILAHLIWTEDFLILQGLSNRSSGIPWLEEYAIETNPADAKTKMSFEELMKQRSEIHEEAMEIINGLTDEDMDTPNYIDAAFGGVNNKRNVIKHAIRHEPMHIGQISWILKANGVKMV